MIYNLAYTFLLNNSPNEVTEEVLLSYLEPVIEKPKKINDINYRLISSSQNAGMRRGVIVTAMGGLKQLSGLLFEFHPKKIFEKYDSNPVKLLYDITRSVNTKIKINSEKQGPRYKFSKTILSASHFLSTFKNGNDFHEWLSSTTYTLTSHPMNISAMPLLISFEIYGVGFALACDFLKEMGYVQYGKRMYI